VIRSRADGGNFLADTAASVFDRRGLRFLWSSFARRFDSAIVRRAARRISVGAVVAATRGDLVRKIDRGGRRGRANSLR
jgi:hypothetical protein